MRINLTVDDRELRALAGALSKGDARFAIAKSLTQTAKLAQPAIKGDLPESFTIRSEWVARGIRIEPARKDSLVAAVGSKDAFMRDQAEGGTKEPKKKTLAIPVSAREPKSKTTTRPMWAKALLRQKDKYFLATILKTRKPGLFEERGEGQKPRLVYYFTKSAKIKPRWHLGEQVETVVRAEYPKILRKNLETEVRRAARRRR